MLSLLLTSKNKSAVVNLFLAHPLRSFSMPEIKAASGCPPKVLAETIKELVKMGFLVSTASGKVRFYQVDKRFALFPELVGMLRKAKRVPPDLLAKELSKLKECKLILITGTFTGRPRIESDILLVGKVGEAKMARMLKAVEKLTGHQVNYTLMPVAEFDYRKIMSDRFIKNVLENWPVIVLDKTKNKSITKLLQHM